MNRRIVQQDNQWKVYGPNEVPEPYVYPWERRLMPQPTDTEQGA